MCDVETRCDLETNMVEMLERRGWAVLHATRRGLDLDLDIEHDGQAGKVLFRNGFDVPKGTASPASAPCFIRVDLGEPRGEPERWALWDHYDFPTGKHSPSYVVTVFHEAMSTSWASVAGNSVASGGNHWYGTQKTLSTLLGHAETLSPSRDEATRRDHLLSLGRRNFGPQRRTYGISLFVALFFMTWVIPVIYIYGHGGLQAALGAAVYMTGLVVLVMAIIGLVALVRRARQPKSPVEGMEAVAESLRAVGAFDAVELARAKKRLGLPVVQREGRFLSEGAAPLLVSRLSASSASHAVTLEADICRVQWPEGISKECRFLPDWWLTVELAGSEAELNNLPTGAREDRRDGRVRWLLTGEEVDAGRAGDLFQSLASALTAPSGPYR